MRRPSGGVESCEGVVDISLLCSIWRVAILVHQAGDKLTGVGDYKCLGKKSDRIINMNVLTLDATAIYVMVCSIPSQGPILFTFCASGLWIWVVYL